MGVNDCDDGNLDNGDGCNDFCEREAGYACSGGYEEGPDTCRDIINPVAELITNNKNPEQMKLKFSK